MNKFSDKSGNECYKVYGDESVPTRDNAAESLGLEGVRFAANKNQIRRIENEIISVQKL